jgi:geranylgeranylglycerol-phosphate geranylgeranyltransferase
VKNILAAIKLIRIHNCLMAGIGVWLGGYLCHDAIIDFRLVLGALAAALVCAAGNAFNDYVDLESDRVNHPDRPLPKGELSLLSALNLAILLNLFALIIGVIISITVAIIVLAAIIWLFFYNTGFKKLPLIGNLSVAILGGFLFFLGGIISAPSNILVLPGPTVPAIFGFLFHLARELIKDMADYKGDKLAGNRTIAIISSERAMRLYISTVLIVLVLFTLIPIWMGWYRFWYGLIAVIMVDLPLGGIMGYLIFSQAVGKYGLAANFIKILMAFGLVAFLAGKI